VLRGVLRLLEVALVEYVNVSATLGRLVQVGGEPFLLFEDFSWRSGVTRGPGGLYCVLINFHHCCVDAMSCSNFLSELNSLLGQSKAAVSLPELPLQYLDFVYWQRHCASQGLFDIPPGPKM
jgi:hypothetical protein